MDFRGYSLVVMVLAWLAGIIATWLAGIFLPSALVFPTFMLLIIAIILLLLSLLFYNFEDKANIAKKYGSYKTINQARRHQKYREFGFGILLMAFAFLGAWCCCMALPRDNPRSFAHLIDLSTLNSADLALLKSRNCDVEGNPMVFGQLDVKNKIEVYGIVTDDPKIQGRARLLVVTVIDISIDDGNSWQSVDGKVEVQTLGTFIEDPYGANYGDSIQLQGKLQPALSSSQSGICATMAFPSISVTNASNAPIATDQADPSIGGGEQMQMSILALLKEMQMGIFELLHPWLLDPLYHLRALLAIKIEQVLPQPEAALLIAIVLGLQTPAIQSLTSAFSITGTSHLIVPSGFKVTILAGIVTNMMNMLYEKREQRFFAAEKDRRWRRWLAKILVILSIVAYTLLSGCGPAAIRAGIMGILIIIAPNIGRTYNVYTSLAFAALLMSFFNPFILWDVGFQLSFLGTLGIVMLTPSYERPFHLLKVLPFGSLISENIAVTLAALTPTLPIIVTTFPKLSIITPIANSATVPLLGILVMLGILICCTSIFPPLSLLCAWIVWPLLKYVDWSITRFASWPLLSLIEQNGSVSVTLGNISSPSMPNTIFLWIYYLPLIGIISAVFWYRSSSPTRIASPTNHQPRRLSRQIRYLLYLGTVALTIIITGISSLNMKHNGSLTVTFLSVGPKGQSPQGEAILIRSPDGKTMLIDGGPDVASLSQALDSQLPPWQRSLDIVVLTSPLQDHITGLLDVVTRYSVGTVIDTGMLHPNTTYARWRRIISDNHLSYQSVKQDDTISLGKFVTFQVLWPSAQLHAGKDEAHDNSLIMQLSLKAPYPHLSMLFLGAAAQSPYAMTELMQRKDNNPFQDDIVQIVGTANRSLLPALRDVLQRVHPCQLIVTPATLSAKSRKAGLSSVSTAWAALSPEITAQVKQTAQDGSMPYTITANDPICP